ncbi:hypothetical protein B0H11DRAFT_2096056 [Mycena galericulata]|nr:hypothetical protein B0H11DRAFT_2096056 [Mycena galericulata]
MSESGLAPGSKSLSKSESSHHPDFYFSDGSAIFSLKSVSHGEESVVLYKLHSSVLGPGSSSEVRTEGLVDENPIQLPSQFISQVDFDNLLIYLYRGPSDHPKTNEFLVSVLALSTFYQINDGRAHAISQLTHPGNVFHPALQFQLARFYRVDDWIEPAFRRLIEMPIDSLDVIHVEQIGLHGFFHLVQTKEKLLQVRRQLAFHIPPTITHADCDTPAYCTHAWAREWKENVPRRLHHPDVPCDSVTLLRELENSDIDELCKSCQALSISWLWGKGWSKQEEEVVEEGIAALMELQTGRGGPPLAGLEENDFGLTSDSE